VECEGGGVRERSPDRPKAPRKDARPCVRVRAVRPSMQTVSSLRNQKPPPVTPPLRRSSLDPVLRHPRPSVMRDLPPTDSGAPGDAIDPDGAVDAGDPVDAAEAVDAAPEPGRACANCGAELTGPYCAQCGQQDRERIGPLRLLLTEAADELLSLDTRLARTLKGLFTRPGFLTNAYTSGRRAAFVPPLRLFLLSGFVFLLVIGLGRQITDPQGDPIVGGFVKVDLDPASIDSMQVRIDRMETEGTLTSSLQAQFFRSLLRANEDPDAINRAFLERLSFVAVLLIPVVGLLLKVLFWRRYYVEHLVFALHLHAFAFLVVSASLLLGFGFQRAGGPMGLYQGLVVLAAGIEIAYFGLSLRRTYGTSVPTMILKGGVLLFSYLVVLSGCFLLYGVATFLLETV